MHADALSDVGLVRKDNEDNYLVSDQRALFAVADGMGGHLGGRIASTMAIQILDEEIQFTQIHDNPSEKLLTALKKANNMIMIKAQNEGLHGMGTTITSALFYAGVLHIAHIGDSRSYLVRDDKLTLLTEDHSLVNELFQNGSLTWEEARNHPQRNVLTRALGIMAEPQIDTFSLPIHTGDKLLLCTDGLTNHLTDQEIISVLKQDKPMKAQVATLINKALERGGNDNVTVVLVSCE